MAELNKLAKEKKAVTQVYLCDFQEKNGNRILLRYVSPFMREPVLRAKKGEKGKTFERSDEEMRAVARSYTVYPYEILKTGEPDPIFQMRKGYFVHFSEISNFANGIEMPDYTILKPLEFIEHWKDGTIKQFNGEGGDES